MVKPIKQAKKASTESLQVELLDLIIESEDFYPWEPNSVTSEVYFSQVEQQFSLMDDLSEAEISSQAEDFFSQIRTQWENADQARLRAKFSQVMPQEWLNRILEQAELVIDSNLSQINQLIACVKPIWQQWTEEDLQVFARPFALNMRDGRDSTIKLDNWDQLSEIEQIRLSLAVAQEALNQQINSTNQS